MYQQTYKSSSATPAPSGNATPQASGAAAPAAPSRRYYIFLIVFLVLALMVLAASYASRRLSPDLDA